MHRFLLVFVGVYKREDSKELSVHGEMRITDSDSYCFMNTNLDKLVFFLPVGLHYSRQPFFSEPHTEEIKLLHRKTFYPFLYADSLEKINKNQITNYPPPLWSMGGYSSRRKSLCH